MAFSLETIQSRIDELRRYAQRRNAATERKRKNMTPSEKRRHTIAMRKQAEIDTEWAVEKAMEGGAD